MGKLCTPEQLPFTADQLPVEALKAIHLDVGDPEYPKLQL